MLTTLQDTKREDGVGVLERYAVNGTQCLWMPGFSSEQIGLQKDHEAKGKYGYSDIPPPPKKLIKVVEPEEVTNATIDNSFIEELRPSYPYIDRAEEGATCE